MCNSLLYSAIINNHSVRINIGRLNTQQKHDGIQEKKVFLLRQNKYYNSENKMFFSPHLNTFKELEDCTETDTLFHNFGAVKAKTFPATDINDQ